MAGFPPDRPFKPVEEEDRAEKSVPAITIEEDEEEVRTEEGEQKEEAFGSLLGSDPNSSVLNPSIGDKESDKENENPQEQSIMITRRNQTTRRGSISITMDRNLRLVHIDRSGAQMPVVMVPPEEDDGSIDSLITQPPSPNLTVNQNLWSDGGSTASAIDQNQRLLLPNRYGTQMSQAMMPPEENLVFGGTLFAQPPYQNQIQGRDQAMNQPQRFTMPNRGFASVQNQSFGVVQQQQQQQWPRFIPDHNYAAGFGPNSATWGPLMPHQTFFRGHAPVDHIYATWRYQQQQMVMMQMQNQSIVPRPTFVEEQNHFNQYFGMQQHGQIVPNVAPGQAPMRPMMYNQGQIGLNSMRPMMQQDQVVPYLVPGQAPMRQMMYSQEHDQVVPTLVPVQASAWPMVYNQDQAVPHVVPFQSPMWRVMYNQDQSVPSVVPFQAPMWPMMYNQDQFVPMLVPNQAPLMFNQLQQINQGQNFGFPIDMIHHQAFPNAAAPPRPEMNHQQMQRLRPQRQQPMQSQGFNAGRRSED